MNQSVHYCKFGIHNIKRHNTNLHYDHTKKNSVQTKKETVGCEPKHTILTDEHAKAAIEH